MSIENFIKKHEDRRAVLKAKIAKLAADVGRIEEILASPERHFRTAVKNSTKYQNRKTRRGSAAPVVETNETHVIETPKVETKRSVLDDII